MRIFDQKKTVRLLKQLEIKVESSKILNMKINFNLCLKDVAFPYKRIA